MKIIHTSEAGSQIAKTSEGSFRVGFRGEFATKVFPSIQDAAVEAFMISVSSLHSEDAAFDMLHAVDSVKEQ